MAESVYKVIELVGTSDESWEKAASAAVAQAAGSLRDLRIAEVVELDLQIEDGQVKTYRAKGEGVVQVAEPAGGSRLDKGGRLGWEACPHCGGQSKIWSSIGGVLTHARLRSP